MADDLNLPADFGSFMSPEQMALPSGDNIPTPPARPANLTPPGPVLPKDFGSFMTPTQAALPTGANAPAPPVRPAQGDLDQMRQANIDTQDDQIEAGLADGSISGNRLTGFHNATTGAPIASPNGKRSTLTQAQGEKEKADRVAKAQADLWRAMDAPLSDFGYREQSPQENIDDAFSGTVAPYVSQEDAQKAQAAAVKKANDALEALKAAPVPRQNTANDLAARAIGAAGGAALDTVKPLGQVAADLGAPGLKKGLDSAEKNLPQGDSIRDKDLSAQVAAGLGSSVPFMGANVLGLGWKALAGVGALQNFGQQYEAAAKAEQPNADAAFAKAVDGLKPNGDPADIAKYNEAMQTRNGAGARAKSMMDKADAVAEQAKSDFKAATSGLDKNSPDGADKWNAAVAKYNASMALYKSAFGRAKDFDAQAQTQFDKATAGLNINGAAGDKAAFAKAQADHEAALNNPDYLRRYAAGAFGLLFGAAQSAPFYRLYEKALPGGGSMFANVAQKMAQGAIEFPAIQSAVQFGNNAVAKGLYDGDRDLLDGVKESAAAAAIVGAMLGLPAGLAHTPEGRSKIADAASSFDWAKELGVSPSASEAEVKAAFNQRAKETHPDAGGSTEAFQRVNAAYQAWKAAKGNQPTGQAEQGAQPGGGAQGNQPVEPGSTPQGAPRQIADPFALSPAPLKSGDDLARENKALSDAGYDDDTIASMDAADRQQALAAAARFGAADKPGAKPTQQEPAQWSESSAPGSSSPELPSAGSSPSASPGAPEPNSPNPSSAITPSPISSATPQEPSRALTNPTATSTETPHTAASPEASASSVNPEDDWTKREAQNGERPSPDHVPFIDDDGKHLGWTLNKDMATPEGREKQALINSNDKRKAENQVAIGKRNSWKKTLLDWFDWAKHGDEIHYPETDETWRIVEGESKQFGKTKKLVAVNPDGSLDWKSVIGWNEKRGVDVRSDLTPTEDGFMPQETESENNATSIGKLMSEGAVTPKGSALDTGKNTPEASASSASNEHTPGAPLENGWHAGHDEDTKFRVSESPTASLGPGPAVSLEKRNYGRPSTFYVGKDGGFIDGDSVVLNQPETRENIWASDDRAKREQARSILQEMGALDLRDPRRKELAQNLKDLVTGDGSSGLDTGKNTPEAEATVHAQIKDLVDGKRAVVMFPRGTKPPERPAGIGLIDNARGTFWYDPDKIDSDEIKAKSAEGRENELLGLGPYSKPEIDARVAQGEKPVTVVERAPDGTELKAAYGTEQTAPEQIAAIEKDKAPGSTVAVEPIEKTIGARKAKPMREAPPVSLVQFLRAAGGLKDQGGELTARNFHRRYPGLVNNRSGMNYDAARELAAQHGYMGDNPEHDVANTTVADFLDKVDQHPTYSLYDHDRIFQREEDQRRADDHAKAIDDTVHQIIQDALQYGVRADDMDGATLESAARLHVEDDVPLEDAFERAAIQSMDSDPVARKTTEPEIPWDNLDDFKGSGRLPWEDQVQEPSAGQTVARGGAAGEPREEGAKPSAQGEAAGGRAQLEGARENAAHQEGRGGEGEAVAPKLESEKNSLSSSADFTTALRDRILTGEPFANILELRKFAKEHGVKADEGDSWQKLVEERMEHALVLAARDIAQTEKDPAKAFDKLVQIYENQPNLSARTSKSVAEQAYSTPLPLAYLASELAGVKNARVILEPTAGNGALLMEADPKRQKVIANELDATRAGHLKEQGFTVTRDDAAADKALAQAAKGAAPDVVIANPPFGAVRDGGESKVFDIGGWKTTQIDHAIALRALATMKPDGRAVLIIGGVKAQSPEETAKGYQGKAKREFFYRLQKDYNVTDHFTVDGDLYERQGAGWPVDVIVIDGKGASSRKPPSANPPQLLKSWDELKAKLNERPVLERPAKDARPGVAQNGNAAVGEPRPAGGNGGDGKPDDGGRPAVRPDAGEKPVPIRGEGDRGQPAGVRTERPVDDGARGPAGERGEPARTSGNDVAAGNGPVEEPAAPRAEKRALTSEESAKPQVAYEPASQRGKKLNTLIPRNLRDAADESLRRIEEKHGPIDDYVAKSLGYKPSELGDYFSAEQIDGLALAIDNVEKGAAFIIGDQTGIGKGRLVAGALAYAHKRGMVPVFTTEKPDLYGDMWRDLHDIGFDKKLGRPIEMFMTNAGATVPLDEKAAEWVAEREAAIEAGEKVPPRYGTFSKAQSTGESAEKMQKILSGEYKPDVVFTTYDQMNSVKGAETDRRKFLRGIAHRAFLILDETHNAGGQGEQRASSDTAPPRSKVFREALANARAAMYSSATYAKSPKVMDLFSRTDMAKAVENPAELPDLIGKGGVPLQQVVSAMLSKAGQYLRRERSFEGVSYEMEGVPVDEKAYDEFTNGLSTIFTFDRFFSEERKEIAEGIAAELGAGGGKDGGIGDAGANTTEFSSIMHNAISQMLLSITAKEAANKAIASLKRGEAPVIALSATMESFVNDYVDATGAKLGDEMNIDFGDVLRRYLERTRRVTIKLPNGYKKRVMIPLSDMDAGTQRMYKEAQDALKEMNFSGLPVSPIDYIRNEIEKAGYSVREITGRGTMIDYSGDKPRLSQRPAGERGASGKAVTKNKFNNGGVDAVILNRSGSTGISLHASEKFKRQDKRRMILVQADPNIDTHLQMLGRVHRTGQVTEPAYSHLVPEVPAAVRPNAVLLKKMASLNANTTGARKSKFSGDAVDFMNQYGDQVAARLMAEDPDLNAHLGYPVAFDDKGRPKVDGASAKVTGRLTLLKPDEQQELLDRITAEYTALIERLDATGENQLEAKTLDLQAEPVSSQVLRPRTGDSPFEDEVRLEQMMVKAQGRAMEPREALEAAADAMEGEVNLPNGAPFERALQQVQAAGAKEATNRAAAMLPASQKFIADRLAAIKGADAHAKQKDALAVGADKWKVLNRELRPGRLVTVPIFDKATPAMVIGVRRASKSKNPAALSAWTATFAVPDSARTLEIPFSQLLWDKDSSEAEPGSTVRPVGFDVTPSNFADMLENARKEGKERRMIFTGNMLSAFDQANGVGQIMNFTTKDGSIQPGIMTPRSFDTKAFMASRAVRFKSGEQAIEFLKQKADGEITSKDKVVTVRRADRGGYEFDLPAAKSTGGKYYADKSVRDVWDNWSKSGSRMRATVQEPTARKIIDAMMKLDAVFETRENQDAATKIIGDNQPPRAPSVGLEPAAPTTTARETEAAVTLQKLMDELLPKSGGVRGSITSEHIPLTDEERRLAGVDAKGAVGTYDPKAKLIELSTKAADLTSIAFHEIYHAMRALGLADDHEDQILRGSIRRMRRFLEENYPGRDWARQPDDEIEAYAAEAFKKMTDAGMDPTLHSGIKKVFRRLFDFLGRAWNKLWHKKFALAEDIFKDFQSGGFKDRKEGTGPKRFTEAREPSADHLHVYDDAKGKPKESWREFRQRMRTNLLDFNWPAKLLGDRLSSLMGRPLRDDENLYLAKRLIPGKTLDQHRFVKERFEDPIVQIASKANLTLGDIGRRLAADHAPERNAAIDELHDWRADYDRRKIAAKQADREAKTAEADYETARQTERKAEAAVAQAQAAANTAASREIMRREPGMDEPTDRAIAAVDAARDRLKEATKAMQIAGGRAADLRAKADEALAHSLTPSEQAQAAAARAERAQKRKQEAIGRHVELSQRAVAAVNDAQHIAGLARIEADRSAGAPDNERQQRLAANTARDAIAARVLARKTKEAAHKAAVEKDEAHRKAVAALDAARKKAEWADAEEARLEKQFERIKGKGSGFTNEQAAEIRATQKAEGKEEALNEIVKIVRQMTNYRQNIQVDAGLVSRDQVAAWNQKYKNYADLRGFEDADVEPGDPFFKNGNMGKKMEARGEESKRAFGRVTFSNNPIVNMFEATHRAIERAEANKAAQVLYRSVEKALDQGADRIDGLVRLDRGESHWEVDKNTGMAKQVQDSRFATQPGAVQVKFDGAAKYVVFDDKELGEDIKRLSPVSVGQVGHFFLRVQGAAKYLWTHMAGAFSVRHFLGRYPLEASLNAGEHGMGAMARAWRAYPIFGAYHRAVMAADGMSPAERNNLAQKVANGTATKAERYQSYYHEVSAEGGLMGRNFFDMENIERTLRDRLMRVSDIKSAGTAREKITTAARLAWAKDKAFMEAWDHVTSNMDAAQRMSAYIEARMRGLSKPQAALESREATVDFSKRGKYANVFGLFKTFYNVAAQTADRLFSHWKTGLAAVAGGVFAVGFANTLLNFTLGGYDDDGIPYYEKVPSHIRQGNLVALTPFRQDRNGRPLPIMFPLPYAFAGAYNIGASLAQSMLKEAGVAKRESHGEIFGRAMKAFVEAATPLGSDETAATFFPTLAEPVLHVIQNKTFTGAPLHNDSEFAATTAPYQGRPNTPDHWKWLAQGLNSLGGGSKYQKSPFDMYPETLRETLGFFTSAQERETSMMIDAYYALQNGQAPDLGKLPGPNVFFGRSDTYDKSDEADFYDRRREVTDAHKAVKAADKHGESDLVSDEQRQDAARYSQFQSAEKHANKHSPGGALYQMRQGQQDAYEHMDGAERWKAIQDWEAEKSDFFHNFMTNNRRE